ncbi:MAG: hypothetical protein WAQ53_06445 [Thiofilum sp.]|uniref:hypothetical protein n=1 Tax=Thiofilum sp. TaxID=2212733 RepID=UPI0025E443B0|nr:hypothetical protein [Thiofilum sp.]MBK8454974.1 hypothetical protein [Thiofilum sp.]
MDMSRFEPYCPSNTCGDPLLNRHNELVYSKRKMAYVGRTWLGDWIFICPVCNQKRRYRESYFGNDIFEC